MRIESLTRLSCLLGLGAALVAAACGPESKSNPKPGNMDEGGAGGSGGSRGPGSGGAPASGGSGGGLGGSGGNGGSGGGGSGGGGSGGGGSGGSRDGAGSGGSGGTMGADARPLDARADASAARDVTLPDVPACRPMDAAVAAPTFTQLYMTVFGVPEAMSNKSCWGADCHNPGTKDGVDFSSKERAYATLIPKLRPCDPSNSTVVRRLETTDLTRRMPLNKGALGRDLIQQIRAWIAAGAKYD